MKSNFRLPSGGRIDRSKPISFEFDGKQLSGYTGDTLASALIANGRRVLGRSFKYHRPRGLLSHGCSEPNALLEIDGGPGRIDPNTRATMVDLAPGMVARSQNCWPTVNFDVGRINDKISPLIAAGFYYKTFLWPRNFWNALYEPAIRRLAGLGKSPRAPDPDLYAHRFAHCDTLVIGAGPAGLAAAMQASTGSEDIILVDEQSEFGGTLLHDATSTVEGIAAGIWLDRAVKQLSERPNVISMPRTTAFGAYNDNLICLLQRIPTQPAAGVSAREILWQVRARRVILATGAHERPTLFNNNDLPGVMLAESVRAYVNRYAALPGRHVVFVTNGDAPYQAAAELQSAGVQVTIVDERPQHEIGVEAQRAAKGRLAVYYGCKAVSAHGNLHVKSITIGKVDSRKSDLTRLRCDCVGMHGGWTPAVHLYSQSGGKLQFDRATLSFLPKDVRSEFLCVGSAAGIVDTVTCVKTGRTAAAELADTGSPMGPTLKIPPGNQAINQWVSDGGKVFVDFQNDVTTRDLRAAICEGFTSIEHVKRYTTVGMATDQGKTSNLNALFWVAANLGRQPGEVGTTTFRPPYTPVTFGALAGQARGTTFEPTLRTPLHDLWKSAGAAFENVGQWHRAQYFLKPGETNHEAVNRECRAVRHEVGVFDASTLGKLEVVGPDAAKFLDIAFTNTISSLQVGKCKYALMLKEDGTVLNDGLVARIDADRYHVTTTTTGIGRVSLHLSRLLQCDFAHLRTFITVTTDQWAVLAIQGPKSRELLSRLDGDINFADEAFPVMGVRCGRLAGIPVRAFRMSFAGVLGYEINIPASKANHFAHAVNRAGTGQLTPYGTDAMHVLRAEAGYIIVGQDTDGTVTPLDLGLQKLVSRRKDFIGRRSLQLISQRTCRRGELVGLLTISSSHVLEEGAQIVEAENRRPVGHVTSSYWSANLDRSIALAILEDGRAKQGSAVDILNHGGITKAVVGAPAFLDVTEAANA